MIGYGLVNSAVHEVCLNQIIVSFLSRSSIFLANFYLENYIKQMSGLLSSEQQDDLVNLFLEEEKYIAIQKNKENPDENFNEEEIVYKYLLTANIILNKDYNYDLKTTEQIIDDGKKALKNIFFDIYQKFLSNLNKDAGDILKLPEFEEEKEESKNFLLNLIKYSTFIFMNYSVAKENGHTDNKLIKVLNDKKILPLDEYGETSYSSMVSEKPDTEYNYNDPKIPVFNYFTSAGKFFNYGEIKPLLFGEFYYNIKQDKVDDFMNEIYKNTPNLKNMFYELQLALKCLTYEQNYKNLQKLGYFESEEKKYYNITPTFVKNITSESNIFGPPTPYSIVKVFGENSRLTLEYTYQLFDKTFSTNFINYSFTNFNDSETNLKVLPPSVEANINTDFDTIKIYFTKMEAGKLKKISTEAILTSENWKDFINGLITLKSGPEAEEKDKAINISFNIKYTKEYSDLATEIITYGATKYFTLSKREILKFYKFSFPEIRNIVSGIRDLGKSFEEYFQLGFRLNLNMNADITKDQDWSNHHIYELFNIPFKQPEDNLGKGLALKLFNKYPPFYENLLFKDPQVYLTAEDLGLPPGEPIPPKLTDGSNNLLYNSFFVDLEKEFEVDTGFIEQIQKPDGTLEQKPKIIKYIYNHNKSSRKLYQNLLREAGVGGSKLPKDNPLFKMLFGKESLLLTINNYTQPQFKINYFITVADFIVNTGNQDIYFSATDDAKESQFLIKKTYYQTVLNQLLEIKNSSDNNNIKYILDSYKFDELKKLSEQYDNFKPTSNYRDNIKQIYDIYNDKAKNYNLLTVRDTSLKILDAQIKVLENG